MEFAQLDHLSMKNAWVTIGAFDGVHRGHQRLLCELAEQAHKNDAPAVVVTFFPHPSVVLKSIKSAMYLTTPDERTELMKKTGIDDVVTLEFGQTLANQSADEFVGKLKSHLGMQQLWVGADFALGKDRLGTIQEMQKLAVQNDYSLRTYETVELDGEAVSSSGIRALLLKGDVEKAASWLGRLYRIDGEIVHGEGRGKSLGIPTANIQYWEEKLLPLNGIYAAWLWWKRGRFPCVVNVGVRPTFYDEAAISIEPFILDFNQDLYGQHVTLEFIQYIRPEMKFDTAESLKQQISEDILKAREVFKNAPKTPGLPA